MASGEDLANGFIQPIEDAQIVLQAARAPEPTTPRHLREKEDLLARLKKDSKKWTTNHPRHRLLDALYGYTKYPERYDEEISRLKGLYDKISDAQRALLEKHTQYTDKFTRVTDLLKSNQELCDRIVDNALEFYHIGREELETHMKHMEQDGKKADRVSVSQSLKHMVRDWTEDGGKYERDGCFACVLKTLDTLYPRQDADHPVKVLLPGAGLGRMGRDIAQQGGFEVTINEWSMFMNVAYRFLETHAHIARNEMVHPFIDSWSHHARTSDMMRPMSFPDQPLNASDVLLVEGDFTTVFNSARPKPQFDVIVTYFFIDTARNLMGYLDTIQTYLKPGGHWINLGPLLYGTAPFVQLSLEDIVAVAEKGLAFEFLDVAGSECGEITLEGKKVRGMEAAYGFNDRALTKNAYQAQFWVAQKRE
ncbi:N2227-like protein-domain-containing protein [Emericellopsis atlantica]|uniref:N2227-like protein-domain-containing protein n=1 Tax=Emericellopsis atlantica TaxID=2614577 RepID=A0A9P7ZSA4_9HYPO|nr:N2227-like protein-domain-containing protein [Emericellopsis atlantica]KAG9256743.1 N2227-like protein-domain-containing protein [Emericellopsis atlantica]